VDTDDALVAPGASGESASAEATPMLEKTAAPTPKATASPPTRPTYLDAVATHTSDVNPGRANDLNV